MAQAAVIAKVSSVTGEAYARDSAGNLRRLKAGDVIREGEVVVSGNGAQVVLALADGRSMVIAERQAVTLDAEVAAQDKPDASDSAVARSEPGLDQLASVIADGGDLDALLDAEAPAAGEAASGNEGHSFVEFLRVVENVDGQQYGFATERNAPEDTFQGALLPEEEVPAEPITVISVDDPLDPATNSVTVTEGQVAVFTVTLSRATTEPTAFSLSLASGTAILGEDFVASMTFSSGVTYDPVAGTIIVPAGLVDFTVSVPTLDDLIQEPTEQFTLTVGGVTGTGTILDNDVPTILVGDPGTGTGDITVPEGNDAVFGVKVTGAAAGSTLTLTLADGTAISPDDYASGTFQYSLNGGTTYQNYTGAITLPAGASDVLVRTTTVDDLIDEANETFTLGATLSSNGTNYSDNATATIIDNDVPTILVGQPGTGTGDITVPEGNDAVFGVKVTGAAAGSTLTLTLADGTAISPDDYASGTFQYSLNGGTTYQNYTGAITLPAGASDVLVRTTTVNDTVFEPNETFTLNAVLASAGATYVDSGTATILDNDVTITTSTASVSEEGLATGNKDTGGTPDTTDSAISTGSMDINGAGSLSISFDAPTNLTSGGQPVTWSTSTVGGATVLTGTAGGQAVLTLTMQSNGSYQVELKGALDHPVANVEDVLNIDIGVTVSNGSDSKTSTLTVRVEDDSPVAGTLVQDVAVTQNTNVMIVLDNSGSMDGTRLNLAKAALVNLINTYDGYGEVAVQLVMFSTTASSFSPVWVSAKDAIDLINSVTANGWTNYDAALAQAMAAWSNEGKLTSVPAGGTLQNVVYFLTDGEPNYNDGNTSALVNSGASSGGADAGIQPAEELIWTNFLAANGINSIAIGVGSGISSTAMTRIDPIAYNGSTSTNTNAIQVLNENNLSSVLQSTAIPSSSGNLLTGATPGAVGADGGYISTISIGALGDRSTYVWNRSTNTIGVTNDAGATNTYVWDAATHTLTVTTEQGGTFVIDMDTGDYSYRPSATMTGTAQEIVGFTLVDGDGDQATGQLTMNVSRNPGGEIDGTTAGNTINGTSGNDIINGMAGDDTIYGLDGNDKLSGGAGVDRLYGGAGNDILSGGAGNDILDGGAGNDVLWGGAGNDNLTGGLGADTFAWGLGDRGTGGSGRAVDTITDFDVRAFASGGDRLDLRDLLVGENSGNLQNYLDFDTTSQAGNTIIRISSTGAFSSGNYSSGSEDQRIVLEGINIRTDLGLANNASDNQIINELISRGKLVTD
ncbi:retention module-containing protein [uncultured Azonexus sp.]|uniref:retention module-containing protein n=1 Tax=uncultured Azonexus sp. TaxID=520307 RepID=UPI002604EE20|nr:retention module-containing protein [uncultured Azonexus sp.]